MHEVHPVFIIYSCFITFYFTFSSDSKIEPVQIIQNQTHDKHNWWYLEYRDKIHNSKNSFIPSSNDKCENLLLNGHWHKPSFNISGIIFEDELGRKLSSNSSYHENNHWHIYNHPFKSKTKDYQALRLYQPRNVKYAGEWRSNDNCKIVKLDRIFSAKLKNSLQISSKRSETAQKLCLTGNDTVMVLGDSRGRQLARAVLSVLNGSVYNDMHEKGKSEHVLEYETQRGKIKYFWSQQLGKSGIRELAQSFDKIKEEIVNEKYADISKKQSKLLVLVSEHLLHPLHVCFGKHKLICDSKGEEDHSCDPGCTLHNSSISTWINNKLINPFKTETLPKLLDLLQNHQNQKNTLQIFFFAASYKISPKDGPRNRMQVSMADEYNKQLSKVIINTKKKYNLESLHWIQVSEKIVLAPFDNLPLVLDATHLSEQNKDGAVGLQDTHRSMLEVLFNYYCKYFLGVKEKGSCCF